MKPSTLVHEWHAPGQLEAAAVTRAGRWLVPAGRALFAAIFLMTLPNHLAPQTVAYAAQSGVPMAGLLVPASGLLAFLGGLSILLGFRARIGAWLLVAFLVPVTLTMHAFWKAADAGTSMIQLAMFMKNLGLVGAALLITHFGAGPLSLDERTTRGRVESSAPSSRAA